VTEISSASSSFLLAHQCLFSHLFASLLKANESPQEQRKAMVFSHFAGQKRQKKRNPMAPNQSFFGELVSFWW
jgi:hypothetical protein